jgi:hypothetical protein
MESSRVDVSRPGAAGVGKGTVCAGVLALEIAGTFAMCSLIPIAWLWIGGRVYSATGSLAADLGVAFLGFVMTLIFLVRGLARLDSTWVNLRHSLGHEQEEGALSRIVVYSVGLALALFVLWYYVLTDAYVMPFMGNGQG